MLYLKKIRVLVSLIFFAVTALIFLDFRQYFSESFISAWLFLQFAPSVLMFINTLGVAALGFVIITVLTLLFGRLYCSSICPLGTLQDIFSRFSNRFLIKRKAYNFSKAKNLIRYGILALTVLVFISGSSLLISMLDPYSNFGRILTYFGKFILVETNNLVSGILENWGYFWLYEVNIPAIRIEVLIVSFLILTLVVYLSFTQGRLYCNTVCPVGTILGFLAKYSLIKISIKESGCVQCGNCLALCKAECIDINNKQVDLTRCISCFNCLKACNDDAIIYSVAKTNKKPLAVPEPTVNIGKRNFIFGSLAVFLGLSKLGSTAAAYGNSNATTIKEDKNYPISPPGSVRIERFNQSCTACTLCVSVCPTNVLQPTFLEYGIGGMLQPQLDFHSGFCNIDCVKCSAVCPTGAILPITVEEKHTIQIGIANFIKGNCRVVTNRISCGICSEHCPTNAVDLTPYKNGLFIPEITAELCIGCGTCEYACPTAPHKAIYVDGIPVHATARKPTADELEKRLDYGGYSY